MSKLKSKYCGAKVIKMNAPLIDLKFTYGNMHQNVRIHNCVKCGKACLVEEKEEERQGEDSKD